MPPAVHAVHLSPQQAPHAIPVPWDRPRPPELAPASAIDAALAQGATHIRLTGGEPLAHPDLHHLLARITDGGARALVRTRLPGLDDDEPVRPFAPHDVRFEVELPYARATDPERWDAVEGGLRNLKAFAYPFDLILPVTTANLDQVADIVAHVHGTDLGRGVQLEVLAPDDPEDPRWTWAPTWAQVDAVLADLHARALNPPPRVHVTGMPILGLSVGDVPHLDVRTDAASGADARPSPAYLAHHPAPSIDIDTLARRRTWLATPPKERPGFRGDARDRFDEAVAVVLVRPHEGVFAVVEAAIDGRPYLARTARHGLAVYGRMADPTQAERFRTLCRRVHQDAQQRPPEALADLRSLAHVLRRSLKPRHDQDPIEVRYETG